jgi:hypothetical protein
LTKFQLKTVPFLQFAAHATSNQNLNQASLPICRNIIERYPYKSSSVNHCLQVK